MKSGFFNCRTSKSLALQYPLEDTRQPHSEDATAFVG